MLKKLLMLCLALALSMGVAFAAVDVNTADQTSLEGVKGLGPVKSKAIIDERTKNGPFKDADDLANRVKGLGTKSVTNLEQAGLTIGGSSAPPTGTKEKTPAATNAGFVVGAMTERAFPEFTTAITHLRDILGDASYESLARKGETMTTAAMAAYAYDQIDQARTELSA